MPRTVPVIVTSSDGTERVFPSCKAAGQFIGMGQVMEMDNADCPMCCDY